LRLYSGRGVSVGGSRMVQVSLLRMGIFVYGMLVVEWCRRERIGRCAEMLGTVRLWRKLLL
jgi:hypothetical protein